MTLDRSCRWKALALRTVRPLLLVVGGVFTLVICIVLRYSTGPELAVAESRTVQDQTPTAENPKTPPPMQVVANVNGQQILRHELARNCLVQYGQSVLETVLNRHLIAMECDQKNVVITKQDIDAEIDQVARRFGLPVDQWLKMLSNNRDISPRHYRDEIIWPTIALRRLAKQQLNVSPEEVQQEIESRFGPQVQARMIVLKDSELAVKVRAAAIADPDSFSALAVKHSVDVNSASSGGMIQPIRRHLGETQIEESAFSLQPGEISAITQIGDQYVILQCISQIEARLPTDEYLSKAKKTIAESIRDRKLRTAGSDLFRRLQEKAEVKNVFNDEQLRQDMPGVAATINGQPITTRELAEACIARHGREVLSTLVNRKIIEVELDRAHLTVNDEDLELEVSRAARVAGVTREDGTPDFPKWFKIIEEQQKVSQEMYLDNIVWPSVALRKLVQGHVEVTEKDLEKAYDANYGPRIRCRAIVMNNLRRAQEVWNMYRANPTLENFARLASEYSVDPGGKSLGGVVPPIQRHGGQKPLEDEAFKLKPGEHSGVIQIADKFVFLLCEGVTKPVVVDKQDVREVLYEDILEKKHRVMMARHFKKLVEQARINTIGYPELSKKPGLGPEKRVNRSAGAPFRG